MIDLLTPWSGIIPKQLVLRCETKGQSQLLFSFFFFNLKERNRTTNKPLVIVMIQDLVTLTNPPHLVLFPSVLQISVCLARTLPYETTVFLQS